MALLDAHPTPFLGRPSCVVYLLRLIRPVKTFRSGHLSTAKRRPPFSTLTKTTKAISTARIKPDATLQGVVSQINTIQQQIKKRSRRTGRAPLAQRSPHARRCGPGLQDSPVMPFLAATICVLFIACLNVAGLIIARTATRGKEMAIRTAHWAAVACAWFGSNSQRVSLFGFTAGIIGIALAWTALQFLRPFPARHEPHRIHPY